VREVKDILRGARNHRRVNTLLISVVIIMLACGLWIGLASKRAIVAGLELSTSNTVAIAEVKAHQDLYRQQYLDSIKDTIEAMNEFQRANSNPEDIKKRGVIVPKWPVPRPLPGKVTESDLRRLPQTGPLPTPIIKTETKKIYIKPKPKKTPMPKPWYKYFDSIR
jgi:hypothetical protein